MVSLLCWRALQILGDWWLTKWTEEKNFTSELNWYYFQIYVLIGLISPFFLFLRMHLLSIGSLKCSKQLHTLMIDNITNAPVNLFHDVVPKGRILNRFSKDLQKVDVLVYTLSPIFLHIVVFLGSVVVCSIYIYYSLFFLIICVISGFLTSRFYLHGSRELERLEGIARSPILNQLSETLNGVVTIRAFEKEKEFLTNYFKKVDNYFKINLFLYGAQTWFGQTLDFVSLLFFIFLITITVVLKGDFDSQSIALLLTYSIMLERSLFKVLVYGSNLENAMVSMERCLSYTKIQSEVNLQLETDKELEFFEWKGKITYKNYSTQYRPNTPTVLKNLNFTINPKEKIGIVGRTGSGKSTICLSLFRILEPLAGSILIDDIDIQQIGLKYLRNKLTLIPQDPTLMEGTLRRNLDPFNSYENNEIIEVLKRIGFYYIIKKQRWIGPFDCGKW